MPLLDANEGAGQSIWRLSSGDARQCSVEFDARLAAGDLTTSPRRRPCGGGGCVLPEIESLADLEAGRLVRLLPEWGAADGVLHLVFTSRRSMLPSVRAVIDFAVEALKDAAKGSSYPRNAALRNGQLVADCSCM